MPVRVQDFNRFNSVNWLYRHWIFWGFAGSPRDFFGSDFWLYWIIPVTWNPEYPPLGTATRDKLLWETESQSNLASRDGEARQSTKGLRISRQPWVTNRTDKSKKSMKLNQSTIFDWLRTQSGQAGPLFKAKSAHDHNIFVVFIWEGGRDASVCRNSGCSSRDLGKRTSPQQKL